MRNNNLIFEMKGLNSLFSMLEVELLRKEITRAEALVFTLSQALFPMFYPRKVTAFVGSPYEVNTTLFPFFSQGMEVCLGKLLKVT